MMELGQLEAHHEEFDSRNVRVVAVSIEGQDLARQTQEQFPHLVVVADSPGKLISAVDVLHPKAGPNGEDVAAPTTIIIDRQGVVQWLYRPGQVLSRLSVKQVLAEVDARLPD
jgi:alkyl hydroperoxide reductase subunit AhpC